MCVCVCIRQQSGDDEKRARHLFRERQKFEAHRVSKHNFHCFSCAREFAKRLMNGKEFFSGIVLEGFCSIDINVVSECFFLRKFSTNFDVIHRRIDLLIRKLFSAAMN